MTCFIKNKLCRDKIKLHIWDKIYKGWFTGDSHSSADSSRWWAGGTRVEQSYICLYTLWFSHTHKNVFGSAPHAFKNPSTTIRQMPSIWQPLCNCGKKWTKASVFHHTAALLEICLDLIVLLLKSVKAPCSSRSLRKVLLDDAWADVSSFRGNGERIGRKRWAPLHTAEEVDLAWLSGVINIAQVGYEETGHTMQSAAFSFLIIMTMSFMWSQIVKIWATERILKMSQLNVHIFITVS